MKLLSTSEVSKLFDVRATYDFALQAAGQRTQILRIYILKQVILQEVCLNLSTNLRLKKSAHPMSLQSKSGLDLLLLNFLNHTQN
jgi:hypothetical protein